MSNALNMDEFKIFIQNIVNNELETLLMADLLGKQRNFGFVQSYNYRFVRGVRT